MSDSTVFFLDVAGLLLTAILLAGLGHRPPATLLPEAGHKARRLGAALAVTISAGLIALGWLIGHALDEGVIYEVAGAAGIPIGAFVGWTQAVPALEKGCRSPFNWLLARSVVVTYVGEVAAFGGALVGRLAVDAVTGADDPIVLPAVGALITLVELTIAVPFLLAMVTLPATTLWLAGLRWAWPRLTPPAPVPGGRMR